MKTKKKYWHILIILFLFLSGCFLNTSISEKDPSVGLNGSFEKTKHHLPLNWNIHAAEDYQKNYKLSFDTFFVKEGKQSLKFEILKVNPSEQLSKKPGFSGYLEVKADEKYKVSFWVKNSGCNFKVTVFGLGSRNIKPVISTNESYADWKYFEHIFAVPKQFSMVKFEVNIFSPGTFWIDDVRIEKMDT